MAHLILALAVFSEVRNEYTIDRPAWDILRQIAMSDMNPEESFIGDVLPEVQKTLPAMCVTIYAVPSGTERYYRLRVHVLESVGHRRVKGVLYQVEIVPRGEKTHVRSMIDLQVVARCRLIRRFVAIAERAILRRSEAVFRRLGEPR